TRLLTFVHDCSSISDAAASTARRYPLARNPVILPSTTGEITDVCRHRSRPYGLERCTSIFTPSNVASASPSEYALWGKAPALKMIAADRYRAPRTVPYSTHLWCAG